MEKKAFESLSADLFQPVSIEELQSAKGGLVSDVYTISRKNSDPTYKDSSNNDTVTPP
jgi:hypothetical protein